MNAKLKLLLLLVPLALGGCLELSTNEKPMATPVADPREAGAPDGSSNEAPSPEAFLPAHQRKVQLSWSTESSPPNVTVSVSADACEDPPRSSALGMLHHERVRARALTSLSVCLSTSAEPQWSMVEDEPGGWHSLAGWAVPAGTSTKVARLLFTNPQGQRQSVVASASLFCPGDGSSRCISVFSAQVGGPDSPASVPLQFAGKGLTQLWWGPDAPPLEEPRPLVDLESVEDLSAEAAEPQAEPTQEGAVQETAEEAPSSEYTAN